MLDGPRSGAHCPRPTGEVLPVRTVVLADQVRHEGAGLAFWFRPPSAAISEIPVDDRKSCLVAHARTADVQDVTVQVTVSFHFADPALVARRLDFAIDPGTGSWT